MKVGVIGVGDMGLSMVGQLIAKQHEVSVYDIVGKRAEAWG
jgi:3-hydroxyisobutyrate dehydrogenase-like beta-hydroxyacid dehydrogenase